MEEGVATANPDETRNWAPHWVGCLIVVLGLAVVIALTSWTELVCGRSWHARARGRQGLSGLNPDDGV
jgi:hypothetical protein